MIALKLKNVFCPGKCVLLQILLVILVGCGGGGGGGGGEDDNGSFTFYSYSLKTPSGNSFSGTIDDAAKKISVSLPYGTSVTNLVASFSVIGTLSPTVTLKVDGNVQTSGVTGNDFSNPVTYHLTDDQGESADYTVEAVVSGKNAFVYVPKTLGSTISIYIIDDNTGKFMHSDTVSYTGSGDFTLYPEPKGRFMYLYDYSDSNTLKAYAINQLTGKLTVVSGSPYSLGTNEIRQFNFTSNGIFLYAVDSIARNIIGFRINQTTGALTRLTDVTTGSSSYINKMVVSINGDYLYATSEKNLYGYKINPSTGDLASVTGSPWALPGTGDLIINPNGSSLYINGYTMYPYSINSLTGSLTSLSSFSGSFDNMALNSAGTFGYYDVENASFDSLIGGTKLNQSTGASLGPIDGSPWETEGDASIIQIHPNGKFLYCCDDEDNIGGKYPLSCFTINQSTGVLTKISGSPMLIDDVWESDKIFFDANGKYLYSQHGNIYGFVVDQETGSLTPIRTFGYIGGDGLKYNRTVVVKMN